MTKQEAYAVRHARSPYFRSPERGDGLEGVPGKRRRSPEAEAAFQADAARIRLLYPQGRRAVTTPIPESESSIR